MQRRKLLIVISATLIAGLIVTALAGSGTIYTWEKTFEVKKPEIECEIEIGDNRIVGCPVKVWVCLKLEDCCWEHLDDELECKCHDDWENKCDDYKDCWEHCCHVNGTYSVTLYWYNETSEEWQYVKHLQEEIRITLTCFKHMETYTFIPKWEGEYKVAVTFAVDSEVYNFTNED